MKAILFDLDGTLLPMDQDRMIQDYISRFARFMRSFGYPPEKFSQWLWSATGAMMKNQGEETNETVFWKYFSALSGRSRETDETASLEFYQNDFQQVKNCCGCNPLAAETIRQLRQGGYTLILATNPLFPAVATHSRIHWAGLSTDDFEWITTYENSSFCKPNPAYYREILEKLDLHPTECLMVGNDVEEDMIAETLGMKTFLLTDCLINKHNRDIDCFQHGSFPELMEYIRSI